MKDQYCEHCHEYLFNGLCTNPSCSIEDDRPFRQASSHARKPRKKPQNFSEREEEKALIIGQLFLFFFGQSWWRIGFWIVFFFLLSVFYGTCSGQDGFIPGCVHFFKENMGPNNKYIRMRREARMRRMRRRKVDFNARAPRQIVAARHKSGARPMKFLYGGAHLGLTAAERRCQELVRRVGGNRSGNTVRVVGCEKNGVKMVELKPGQMVLVKYAPDGVRDGIMLAPKKWAITFSITGKEPPCGNGCRMAHIPRHVVAVLGLSRKAFALTFQKKGKKTWWLWRNTTGSKIAIVFVYNGPWYSNSGIGANGKVRALQLSYTLHDSSEYDRLEKLRLKTK